jgi:hypothetical protein
MGRPSSYTQEIADEICEQLIEGKSLRSICLSDDMPSAGTVCRWLGDDENFRKQYERARDAQADTLADEILDIADDGSNDFMGEDEKYNGDAVARSKLRVDARKWIAAKLKPKKYGDKTILGSDPDNPLPAGFQVQFVKPDVSPES